MKLTDYLIHLDVGVYTPDPSGARPKRTHQRIVVTVKAASPKDAALRLQGALVQLVSTSEKP